MAADPQSPASRPQPPPLDPTLILRARAALLAAGLPGDAIEDEVVAGLMVEFVRTADSLRREWWALESWWLARQVRQVIQSP